MEENIAPSLDSIPQLNQEMLGQNPTIGGVLNTAAFDVVHALLPKDAPGKTMPMPAKYTPEKIVDTPVNDDRPLGDIVDKLKSLQPKDAASRYGSTKAYDADYTGVFYDRYADMTNVFDKYGFSPWRDNEKLYNDNASWLDRFKRSASNSMSLAGISFKGALPWNAWSSDISKEDAVAQERAFGRGYDSKGGFGSFMNNQVLNAGFTIGMLGEFAAESIVEGAVSLALAPETAGGSLLGFADIARKGYKVGKGIIQGGLDVAKMSQRLNQTAKAMKDINLSRKFFDVVNAERLGKALTPNVLDEVREIQRLSKAGEELTNLAKTARTVGAFYKDVRIASGSVSESKMEAGSVELKIRDDLTTRFFRENNRMPNDVEQTEMAKKAHEGAMSTFWANLPAIYLSNKIVFDKAFSSMKPLRASADQMANVTRRYGIEKGADGLFKEYGTGIRETTKRAFKSFKEPKNLGKNMLVGLGKYTKANVTEGLQEQYQEGVSDAFTRYYEDLYFDPSHVSSKLPYLSTGLARQFTTAQGWETFASGFMMGGLMQGPQYLAFTKGKDLVQSTFKKEKYNAAKAQEKDMVANMVTALNETDDFIKRYSKGEDLNSAVQIRNAKHLANATVSGNKKAYIDIVDDSLANHFYTLAASGKMSVMKDQIKDYQNMSPEEQMQAFGIGDAKANPAKIAERLSHMAKLAEDIEERYKVVDEEYVNPFNPLRYDPKTEMVAYMKERENKEAFEEAKKWAVTSSYQYDNTVKRLQSIYAKASNTPVEGALANDFQILYNTDKAMDKEYKTLVSEIDSFEGVTGLSKNDRSDLNFKKRKVKYLDAYINAKAFYTDAMQSGNEERIEKAIPDLYKAYVKYTSVIAENVGSPVFDRKTLSTFMNILDFYKLGEEKAHLAHAVNFLNNPEGIGYMTSRISKILANINNKRQVELEKALLAFKDQAKLNKTLNRLLDIGLFIDKPEMTDLLEGRPVTKFYQVGAEHAELPAASDKYPQAIDIVTDYRIEKGFITAEEIETHNAKVAEEHANPTPAKVITESYDKPWRNDKTKVNKATSFALESKPTEKFELVKDLEDGYYSVHFKTTGKDALTESEKVQLIQAIANAIPQNGKLSTWGEITKGGISGLNRFKTAGFIESGETRKIKDKAGKSVEIPVLIKASVASQSAATVNPKADLKAKRQEELKSIEGIKKTSGGKVSYAWRTSDGTNVFSYDDSSSEEEVISKINAKYDALEGKKTEGISEDDFKALRKKGFTEKVINTLTPAEVDEIFKSFADNSLDDITQTEILKRRKEAGDAQKAAEKKAKSKSYEKLTADLVAEATALQNKEQYAEFMNKIKDYKTDSYDMAAVDSILAPKRKEYGDAEYAKKKVTYDQIKDGDLVYLPETGTSKMYVVIKLEKTNSFKLYLKGANPKTATTEYPAEDVPKRILQVANMKETKIEPVSQEAKEAAAENVSGTQVTQEQEDKALAEAKTIDPMASLKNTKKIKGC